MRKDRAEVTDPTTVTVGQQNHWNRLFQTHYPLLERRAAALLRGERPDHTLDAGSLLHEAFARLAEDSEPRVLQERYLLGAAARAMQCVLIDHARRRTRLKRGGSRNRTGWRDDSEHEPRYEPQTPETLLALEESLAMLQRVEPRLSEVVRLRFLLGLSVEETATAIGRSERSVKRDWAYARAWLHRYLEGTRDMGQSSSSPSTRP